MAKEVIVVTDGTYSLEETKVENQFYFFRNNHEVLRNVGTLPIEMYARYLIYKVKEGKVNDDYTGEIIFELSADRKILRMTASKTTKPDLRIVKNEESKAPEVTKPNHFMRVFTSWFGN